MVNYDEVRRILHRVIEMDPGLSQVYYVRD